MPKDKNPNMIPATMYTPVIRDEQLTALEAHANPTIDHANEKSANMINRATTGSYITKCQLRSKLFLFGLAA